MKYLDRATNIALLCAVAVFLFIVGRNELTRRSASPLLSPKDFMGKTVKLPGVQFSQQHNSLILAISTACHFCQQSLPFYHELTDKTNGQLDVIALLPQSKAEATKFLDDAHVHTTEIVSAGLDSIGVSATPTLLLVNGKGKVIGAWIGELDDKGKQQLFADVLPDGSSSARVTVTRVGGCGHT